MLQTLQRLAMAALLCVFAGCQSGASKNVDPKFGLQTLSMVGALKFEQGTNSVITDLFMRLDEPGKFELIASKAPGQVYCHILADKEDWKIEFPEENRTQTGHGPPSNERLALWVETHRMATMAVRRAQSVEELSQGVRGEYDNGHHFIIELSEFRNVFSNIFATRMRITCRGCETSIEIKLRDLK